MQPRESKREISREKFDAVLLDLDGVITDTASLHAACWKQVFDEYLRERTARNGETFRPFDLDVGLPALRRRKAALRRGSRLSRVARDAAFPREAMTTRRTPKRSADSGTARTTWCNKAIEDIGVQPYEGSVRLIQQLRRDGFKIAVVTSSQNCDGCPEGRRAGGLLRRPGSTAT